MRAAAARALLAGIGWLPLAANADGDSLQQLRAEIEALRTSYEARLRQLEDRLARAEAAARGTTPVSAEMQPAAQPAAARPPVAAAATGPAAAPGAASANAFNPAISLVLAGSYASLGRDPARYRISGFLTGDETGPGRRGFSLAESEVSLAANVDPYLAGALTFAVAPDNLLAIEEAFFQTTALGNGLRVKGGRFFSGVGYLNEQHSHTWDFFDAPLAYQAFLGTQFAQDGLQLRWLAPTDLFVELGAEIGNSDGFPATARNRNGAGSGALTAHAGSDIGASSSWRAGISYLSATPRERSSAGFDISDNAVRNVFSGTNRLWLADFVWKWAPNGNPVQRNLKLQAEFFRRRESGTLLFDADGSAASGAYASRQWGAYAQAAYQFMPRWSTGLRYDRLDRGEIDFAAADPQLLAPRFNPSRWTAMLSFAPSEFSRFRLQFAADRSRPGSNDHQFRIDYQMSLGAHGAHSF